MTKDTKPSENIFPNPKDGVQILHRVGAAGSPDKIKIISRPGKPDKVIVRKAGKARSRRGLADNLEGDVISLFTPNARVTCARARDPALFLNFKVACLGLRIQWLAVLRRQDSAALPTPKKTTPARKRARRPALDDDVLAEDLVRALTGEVPRDVVDLINGPK
ncbi:hypothetical protein ABS71_10495 [bacterium SCN 62-11]|nr:MAG: hypothetical protein ABS71_10495 [bacterium SCN 62-11]